MDDALDFRKSRLHWEDAFQFGELTVSASQVLELLQEHLTPERRARLDQVVSARSRHVVPMLENIYDRGNVSAVMRTVEAFGFLQMCLVDAPGARFKAANRVTRGAEKWLDVRPFASAAETVTDLKSRGYQIWATDLDTSISIDQIDWSRPTAIVLGNEKDGVTREMRDAVDGCFRVPMLGFSQSFNISVAAALIFYRAHLETRGLGEAIYLNAVERRQVLANYYLRCFDHPENILAKKLNG